jgi:hypothetical protein
LWRQKQKQNNSLWWWWSEGDFHRNHGWLFASHAALGLLFVVIVIHQPSSVQLGPILLWSLRAFSQCHPVVSDFLCSLFY